MLDYNFLRIYLELQTDIMFDMFTDLGFAIVCYSKTDTASFWNNALIKTVLTATQIDIVSQKLKELDRSPAFYFEHTPELFLLSKSLLATGYTQVAKDSFMFFSGAEIKTHQFHQVKKVMTNNELDVFLHTFNNCYQKDDPLNPYGELGEYIIAAKMTWEKHGASNRVEYFIVYDDAEPVAVATLTNHHAHKVSYISNVGSLMHVRGRGFGKLATHYCVNQSKVNGNKTCFLITEEGTYPYEFYQAIGFQTRLTANLLSKESI